MTGYIALGIGFGILLYSKGYGILWSALMGGLIYAGSMQYAAINLITGGASLITTAITTLMVNFFLGLASGVSVTVAHSIGAQQDEAVHRVVHTAMPIAFPKRQGTAFPICTNCHFLEPWKIKSSGKD